MEFNRRDALRAAVGSTAAWGICPGVLTAQPLSASWSPLPCFVSTWRFGMAANDEALRALLNGASLLDAVEQGIKLVERDASNGSVGIGGTPNADGVVQLDACIMNGPGHKAGSVAALEGFLHPISVARRVMEATPHVMLVGSGAADFARRQGFSTLDLLTDDQKRAYSAWKASQPVDSAKQPTSVGHDTIALIGIDAAQNIAGGCSTSGMGYKLPGRVGDSPILGSGLYVDNEVGGAGATGVGENVMRFCGSFMIVEGMRHGLHPLDACVGAIRRIAKLDGRPCAELHVNFIAVNREGHAAAAGTDPSFEYAVTTPQGSDVRQAELVAR